LSEPQVVTKAVYKRRLSNFLLDKKLQLRYVLLVVTLSGLIAGTLGYMLYQQKSLAVDSIASDLKALDAGLTNVVDEFHADNLELVYKMVGAGLGLVLVLSIYLLMMTHKVAGPLYKVSMYFDRMAAGKLGTVTPLRRGDMLQDFFAAFRDMHLAVRSRFIGDAEAMSRALAGLRSSGNLADYRGDQRAKLDDALDALEKHLEQRKKQLA
jgi:methyl-accepting chemotaxis protein